MQNKLILRNEHSPYNDITQGSVLSTGQLDGNLIFLKGLAINSAVSSPSTITLKRINGEEIVIPYSGNTGSGTTINQNNKFIFIDLGYFMLGGRGVNIDESNVEQYISPIIQNRLNNINLTVREDELIIFKCKFTIYGSFNEYRYKFYFPNNLGKGIYNPLGNTITYNMLEIAYKELNVITTNSLTNSPNVNIINLGEIPTNDYLDYINNNGDQYDFTDTNKIHYFRFTYNNVDKIYVFDPNQSLNGYSIYGLGLSQFSNGDLVLFYDSSIVLPNPNTNYWTAGSSGSYSIKANNPSGLDSFGTYSHAEGANTTAAGNASHAEGAGTVASGNASHAEGANTTANGEQSHAEGDGTVASGTGAHSEGNGTTAAGNYSHAGGNNTTANGEGSFVHGDNSIVNGNYSIVLGNNIIGDVNNTTYVDRLSIKTHGPYSNDLDADNDTDMPSGGLYTLTGSRIIYIKP
jgi:hypothetical protein